MKTRKAAMAFCPGTFCLAGIFIHLEFSIFYMAILQPCRIEICAQIKGGSLGLSAANDVVLLTLEKQQWLSVLAPFAWEKSIRPELSFFNMAIIQLRTIELCAQIRVGSLGLSPANDVALLTLEKQQWLSVQALFPWEESSSVQNSASEKMAVSQPRTIELCAQIKGGSLGLSAANDVVLLRL